MANDFPESHAELLGMMQLLEQHYRDMCDIEFTVEQGKLFMLQVRVGKRTAAAALKIAVDMEQRGAHRRARRRCCASRPTSSTSSSTRSSIPR